MDGVTKYVTVRRDVFAVSTTTTAATTTSIPVTLTQTKHKPNESNQATKVNQFDCSLCSQIFSSRALLTRHLKTHNIVNNNSTSGGSPTGSSSSSPDPTTGIKCEQGGCNGRLFASQVSLVKHIKTDHPAAVESHEIKHHRTTPSEKRFICGTCSKRFPTSKDLKRHDVVHTGNREFQCSFCSHRFGRKDHRMRHEKKTHANELSSSPISPLASSSVKSEAAAAVERPQRQQRWRHVSSPSVSTTSSSNNTNADIEMTDLPPTIRIRAMSTSENLQRRPTPSSSSRTDAPLFEETSLKYLESQLSPESLLMEDTTASEDDSTWMMSDLMIEAAASPAGQQVVHAPVEAAGTASPPETPDPASLSPPLVLYETTAPKSCQPSSMGDFLTRTKNPVLPSVYIDNSLIVPEPSKQKYQNSNPSGFTIDDVDDYFDAFDAEIFPV